MARASTPTLLSLDRYAKILGLAPAHFNGAIAASLTPVIFPDTGCTDLWYQYDWQNHNQVSREQLAMVIAEAEEEIANVVNYWPAPTWIADEKVRFGRLYDPTAFGTGVGSNIDYKAVRTRYGNFISAGRRAVTLVGEATTGAGSLAYTDEDGDGLFETATITLTLPAGLATLTDECEVKVYFDGEDTEEWEIRPARTKSIAGGVVTMTFYSWLFIDPALFEAFPTPQGAAAIDISTTTNFVTAVDVYREYTDTTQASAVFYWENSKFAPCGLCGGAGCEVCSYTTQNGCMNARDTETGLVVPLPATYSEDNSRWEKAAWEKVAEPTYVSLWYYSGDVSRRYQRGQSCEMLSDWWAKIIFWIATARLERPICSCATAEAHVNDLRTDLMRVTRDSQFFLPPDVRDCPFGSRKGEIMAWRRIKKVLKRRNFGSTVI